MHDKISGIYCIENIETKKKYIGQSVDIYDRWRRHISELNANAHHNDYLQKAWKKYGYNSFKFTILELCEIGKLDEKEEYYIEYYNTLNRDFGYNLKTGGQNGGSVYSEETKNKMSQATKNSFNNSERRKIQSENALRQWENPIIKQKIVGENNGMYGKHHSEESKRKMSENSIGKISWRRNRNPVFCIELNKYFLDATEAGKELNIRGNNILCVCRGERKTCGGYHFEFVNNSENKLGKIV